MYFFQHYSWFIHKKVAHRKSIVDQSTDLNIVHISVIGEIFWDRVWYELWLPYLMPNVKFRRKQLRFYHRYSLIKEVIFKEGKITTAEEKYMKQNILWSLTDQSHEKDHLWGISGNQWSFEEKYTHF